MAKLKGTSYHTIVTLWPTIRKHKICSIENQIEHLVSNTKSQVSNFQKKNGLRKENPNTGEFFQLEDLRAVGAVPGDFRKDEKPKKYPVKKIDEIIRIKKADGTEWLVSRQTWVGLDRLGNDMTKCFVDPELYDKPVFNYQSKPVNPKDVFSKTERKAVSVTYIKEPTVPFTPKNLEQLYSTCSNPADRKSICLVIKNEETHESPRSIPNSQFQGLASSSPPDSSSAGSSGSSSSGSSGSSSSTSSFSVSSRGTLGISSISSDGNRVSGVGGNSVSAGRSLHSGISGSGIASHGLSRVLNSGVGIGVVGNSPLANALGVGLRVGVGPGVIVGVGSGVGVYSTIG
jgi:hypothetical protein